MKDNTIFVDTGAWFALADESDQYHKQAVDVYPGLFRDNNHLTTTNLVIAETYILIRRAIGHQPAMMFLQNIAASPRVRKVYSDQTLEKNAEDILGKYQDQDFSYTDAVSFAAMKHYGTHLAFSFDRHFVTAGFTIIP
ncbi:MAG: type II toxin-antitoxin system VapC family toxin [Deltaproteobacteria bacterium]|uniref:Type II toxin-antitoxin system VapC family toxin n=1 Tax=Candidatus Desulfacyla euxinica TaxID=2841693 RepID=A0A8J6N328_9DELT|nr:type II toxin-antitoxin system VapC family toxin [Candidatus Desulfacyla euxinica]